MRLDEFTWEPRIAFFSMEIAAQPEIPTYSGGLGILAGDALRAAADLDLALVGVTLVSHLGYFRQGIDEAGQQTEQPDPWEASESAIRLEAKVTVPVEGRSVWTGGWLYILKGARSGQPVILLDTDLYENSPDDREITNCLYGGDDENRLKQEIVLGIGGVRLLGALGFHISHYHMNEGHSSLLALELLRSHAVPSEDLRGNESPYSVRQARDRCSFTTHTPVESGHDKFSYDLVDRVLPGYMEPVVLRQLAGTDCMNMTRLALNLSKTVNGVAKSHTKLSHRQYPDYAMQSITNGVHPDTWTTAPFARLYDTYVPGWRLEPELLSRVENYVSDDELWSAHESAKMSLVELVREKANQELDPQLPTIGFARRFTAYKRPDLLFTDLNRLRDINEKWPFQLVLAGKAHPADEPGKQLIQLIHDAIRELSPDIKVVYLADYDMAMAKVLTSGTDIWLNTPLPPLEASGTSGMKAAFNGVPTLSVRDGWWIEGCIEGVTGWSILGEDPDASVRSLYKTLQQKVLPCFYNDRSAWIIIMKSVISKNAPLFNTIRMMRRYVTETYGR